jgi:D-glycero-D-manno-heptose 1,7-bisphosphate phosphatase
MTIRRAEGAGVAAGELSRVRHVILDRDGVLNREAPGSGWITRTEDWAWEAEAREGLTALGKLGVRLSVATNQSCIGRGWVGRDVIDGLHARVSAEASALGAALTFFLCPHVDADACDCRKPKPGLLKRAIASAGFAPHETLMVGDMARDLEAGAAAATRVALIRTGKGRATEAQLRSSVLVFDNLVEVARWVATQNT